MGLRSIDTDIYRWVSVVYRLNWHSAVVSVEIDCDKLESPSTGIQEESFGSGKNRKQTTEPIEMMMLSYDKTHL